MSNYRLGRCLSSIALCTLAFAASAIAIAEDSSRQDRSFFADRQAFRNGDMLTVVITEAAAATSTARTRADKSDKISVSGGHIGDAPQGGSIGANSDFDGGGEIQRTGQLLGKLTVVVDQIDSNGNLSVVGEQTIMINNEQQHIAVRGMIRPDDIGADNTIPSWRIYDAKIEFKGKGILARKQSPGLMSKLFDLFGLN